MLLIGPIFNSQSAGPSILMSTLQLEGGLCDVMTQQGFTTEADQQEVLQPFVDIINAPEIFILSTGATEGLKSAFITTFQAKENSIAEITQPIQFLAMVGYLLRTKSQAFDTAAKLDGMLNEAGNPIFVAGSILFSWTQFHDFAEASKALTETAASARIQKLKGVAEETRRYTTLHLCRNPLNLCVVVLSNVVPHPESLQWPLQPRPPPPPASRVVRPSLSLATF